MPRKASPPAQGQRSADATDPWSGLDAEGQGLTVDHFLTTRMSQVGNALRRTITVPYADQFELTVSEWRLLALLAHAKQLPFAELVTQSTSDKALVSRALRLLEVRGFVELQSHGPTPRKKLTCSITPAGMALHEQVIPIARRGQARLLHVLTPEERKTMFTCLRKLQEQCRLEAGRSRAALQKQ